MPFKDIEKELEQKYLFNCEEVTPLVVFDFMVYVRNIEALVKSVQSLYGEFSTKEKFLEEFIWHTWAYKLNRGCDALKLHKNPKGFTGLVISDAKGFVGEEKTDNKNAEGYWRNHVTFAEGLDFYKGGRKPKDDICLLVKRIGRSYVLSNPNFIFVEEELFEADDLAGEIVRQHKRNSDPNKRVVYLSTIDNDWAQLVSDEHKVIWVNCFTYNPRIRGEEEFINYYIRTTGIILDHPKQVALLKHIKGDYGDNLAKGSPLRLFDLLEEDKDYRLSDYTKTALSGALNSFINSCDLDQLRDSARFFLTHGFLLPEVNNPTTDQYNMWEANVKRYTKKVMRFSELLAETEGLLATSP